MRKLLLFLLFITVGCQVKPIRSLDAKTVAPPTHVPTAAPSPNSATIAGRVFQFGDCRVHLEFLAVDVTGPEPKARTVCTAPVSPTGSYQAICKLKSAEYAVQLRNTRDGRTLRSSRIDLRTDLRTQKPARRWNEIDFEACGPRTAELAQPESVPGAAKREESSLE